MNITYSECVFVALGIQHAMRMRHIVTCGLHLSTIFFYIISQTARFSKRKVIEHTVCVFWFSLQRSSETFLILRRNERDVTKNVYWSSCEVPLLLSDFNESCIFSKDFLKILKYQISWKSIQWKPSNSMRTDRHNEGNSRFCNLANALKRDKEASLVRSHTHCLMHCDRVTNYNIRIK
jgi:hypothetical protein